MLKFLNKLKSKTNEKKQEILKNKYLEVRHWITNFFEDLQIGKESIELPAWLECQNLMKKLNIDMQHPHIINYYYNKIKKNKLINK